MSVTAVPLHPVTKGTVPKLWIGILLLIVLGAGLAWVGTGRSQFVEGNDGIRYRVWDEGTGEPVTADDVAMAEVEQRGPDGSLMMSTRQQSGGQLEKLFSEAVPAWLNPLLQQMRAGGAYQVLVPVRVLAEGRPLPPNAPFTMDQSVEFRIKVYTVDRGGVERLLQQSQQQMMQQQAIQQQMQEMQSSRSGGVSGPAGAPTTPAAPRGRR